MAWPLRIITILTIVFAAHGCDSQPATAPDVPGAALNIQQPDRDHFALAFDFLDQRNEHNLDRAARQTIYHLNRWIADQAADSRWMLDRRLLNSVPNRLLRASATKEMLSDRTLARLEFIPSDVLYIEENRWLYAVAHWAVRQPTTPAISAWAKAADLSPKTARQLAICQQLFDWTIGNVQLDRMLPAPKQVAAGPSNLVDGNAATADLPAPMRGPGPGYRHLPWHMLMYAHGDALEKARVFILLLRQQHIDAVMLGIKTRTGRPRPWIPAVFLDQQLYLFDPALGLPIPGPDGQPVATLGQVVSDPTLLSNLSVGDKYRYPIGADDLPNVVALIDASPEALSQRMKVLETHVDAKHAMVLTVAATQLKRDLTECADLQETRLWSVPLEAAIYHQVFALLSSTNQQVQMQEFADHGILTLGLNPVVIGRRQHLLGNFQDDGDVKGATAYYLEARTTNAQIEALTESDAARRAMGLEKPQDMPEHIWQQNIQKEKFLHIQAKQYASIWISLIHLQAGNYEVAANWLEKRTLGAWPDGPWTASARLNLALCREKLGDPAAARELLLIDDSPQRHGSLLRAAQILKDHPELAAEEH